MECNPKTLPINFDRFPAGCCGDTCLLLAKYLQRNGCGTFEYVLGQRGIKSHSWLSKDGVLVDITASQFKDQDSPVIVITDISWHKKKFPEISYSNSDFEKYDKRTQQNMAYYYGAITSKIHP